MFGELPGIVTARPDLRADLLAAYCHAYLEEELRREALVMDWGAFARFLALAAVESGQMINYAHLAREAGVSLPTVRSHYQLLEDMFIGTRVPAFSSSARRSLLSTDRFLFFDLGVRHAAAGLDVSAATVEANPGPIFEQWVGIELWKRLRYTGRGRLLYYRTKGGAEIDFVVDTGQEWVPVEVKWSENPSDHDARHLETVLAAHPVHSRRGLVVARCPRPQRLTDRVLAMPWWLL